MQITAVSSRLGHANTRVTMDHYVDLLKEKEQSQNDLALSILNNQKLNI